jgi:hypothetical protein
VQRLFREEFIPLIGPFTVAAVAVRIAALHDPMFAARTTRLGESDNADVRSASLATS